ncbi:inositol monophosphatase family protein [Marinobacter sp.]|uniref:inositol monophosphatase family protein n=1 Tax=Marinobacter sp. TaxID=50741 RepID=UPI00384EDD3B
MQPAIKMALRVARQGSDFLKAHFERQEQSDKDQEELRSQLIRIEQSLYDNFAEQLQKSYKDHVIAPLGEADAGGQEKTWHIFPMLGHDNFLRGIPEFALALLQKKDNRAENLLLVNPVSGEEYAASRGHGSSLNSRRVRTSSVSHPDQASVVTNILAQARGSDNALLWGELAATMAQQTAGLRTSGCVALDIARVAAGRLDAAVIFRPEPADLTIGLVIANESGALTGDFSGNPFTQQGRQMVVANPKLFKEVLKILQPFRSRLPQ